MPAILVTILSVFARSLNYAPESFYREQAECLRTDAIKTLNFPFPDYKAPLAPKRELLAIHMGGVA